MFDFHFLLSSWLQSGTNGNACYGKRKQFHWWKQGSITPLLTAISCKLNNSIAMLIGFDPEMQSGSGCHCVAPQLEDALVWTPGFLHNRELITQKLNHPLEQHKPYLTLMCSPDLIEARLCHVCVLKTSSAFVLSSPIDSKTYCTCQAQQRRQFGRNSYIILQ